MVRIPAKALGEARRAARLLARRMRAEGRSQREVAKSLGVSLSHLNKVLAGRHPLKIERLYGLLGALGIRPVDFFTELHGPGASFPAFRLEIEDDAGGRPTINVFLFAEQMLAKERKAARREARQRRRERQESAPEGSDESDPSDRAAEPLQPGPVAQVVELDRGPARAGGPEAGKREA